MRVGSRQLPYNAIILHFILLFKFIKDPHLFHNAPFDRIIWMPFSSKTDELNKTVIEGGYCIGCGACTAISYSPFRIYFDEKGQYAATMSEPATSHPHIDPCRVCPFAEGNPNEDSIAKSLFAANCSFDEKIGYFRSIWGGCVADESLHIARTSGGFCTWLLRQLLKRKMVDGIVHVIPVQGKSLFQYAISRSLDELNRNAKSAYYPVEMSAVLREIREKEGRYALVATPSFTKALRLLASVEPVFAERIRYCIGVISGHLKSSHYADLLAWQCGIEPGKLIGIDFRLKKPGRSAKSYATEVYFMTPEGKRMSRVVPASTLFGTYWGLGFLKYYADEYSDDVIGETADVSIGDAWIPKYSKNWKGNNIIVVRNENIHNLVQEGISSNELNFEALAPHDAMQSQNAGYRHRREGLLCRIRRKDEAGQWHPPSRVTEKILAVDVKRIPMYMEREELSIMSHVILQKSMQERNLWRFFLGLHWPTWRYALRLRWKIKFQVIGQMYYSIFCYLLRRAFKFKMIRA